MGKIAIEFQNISKQYALGSIGTGTLSRDLNRWWARIRGKEDPYLSRNASIRSAFPMTLPAMNLSATS